MSFTPKSWVNGPSTATPIDAAALIDLETRLSAYTDSSSAAGSGVIKPWTSSTAYALGQPVTNGGQTYLAVDVHTSGGTFAGDLAAHWTVLPTGSTTVPIVSKTSNFTVATADAGCLYEVNSAGAVTITVPSNATDPIPIGTYYEIFREGVGAVNFLAGSGATLHSPNEYVVISRQYDSAVLHKRATNDWRLRGNLQ